MAFRERRAKNLVELLAKIKQQEASLQNMFKAEEQLSIWKYKHSLLERILQEHGENI